MVKRFYLYMLKCRDGSYYVGHTDNLEKRLGEHVEGTSCDYTARRRPVTLVFLDEFLSREEALEREQQLKGWSRRKKEALIARDWDRLRTLAKRYGTGSRESSQNNDGAPELQ